MSVVGYVVAVWIVAILALCFFATLFAGSLPGNQEPRELP